MKKTMVFLFPLFSLLIAGQGFAQQVNQKVGFTAPLSTTVMELFIPAFILFALAFSGLSIGIIFGRKGISGSCSSAKGENLNIQCLCEKSCDYSVNACDKSNSINAVCTNVDGHRCRER